MVVKVVGAREAAAMAVATGEEGKAAATGEVARMVGSEEVATGEVVRVEETVVAEKGEANMEQKPGHCKSLGHQMGLVR